MIHAVALLPRALHVDLAVLSLGPITTLATGPYRALVDLGLAEVLGYRPCGEMAAARLTVLGISALGRRVVTGDIAVHLPTLRSVSADGSGIDLSTEELSAAAEAWLIAYAPGADGEAWWDVTPLGAALLAGGEVQSRRAA